MTRAFRLLPNTRVAMTTAMVRVAPRMAERTGTASSSAPGSRAKRMPVTAETGRPADDAVPATRRGPPQASAPRADPAWRARRASTTATAPRTTTRISMPRPSTVQSKAMPGSGS